MEPGLEEIGVPQGANLAPGGEQRRLDGVVSKVEVAKDPERDRHASVAGHASQGVEGLSIASLRLVHQLCVHPSLRGLSVASRVGAIGLESLGPAYRFNLCWGQHRYPHSDLDGPATMESVFSTIETR